MTVAQNHDASEQGERPSWAWPLQAFVAWLARLFGYIARFKRARRFKPDWRDSWQDLREAEWLRDQMIAQGLAQLLAGRPLQPDDTKINLTPPADYGGPCPRSPFEMNRRFIAIARWAADPEAIIRRRHARIVRAAHGSARTSIALVVSCAQSARPSHQFAATAQPANWSGGPVRAAHSVLPNARGPPILIPHQQRPPHPSAPARLGTPPRAQASLTSTSENVIRGPQRVTAQTPSRH